MVKFMCLLFIDFIFSKNDGAGEAETSKKPKPTAKEITVSDFVFIYLW